MTGGHDMLEPPVDALHRSAQPTRPNHPVPGLAATPEVAGVDPEADLHGDFAAGERTEPIAAEDAGEGSFGDTTPTA
jgi:hypothetical protein